MNQALNLSMMNAQLHALIHIGIFVYASVVSLIKGKSNYPLAHARNFVLMILYKSFVNRQLSPLLWTMAISKHNAYIE